jgi:hypothetical protein
MLLASKVMGEVKCDPSDMHAMRIQAILEKTLGKTNTAKTG